MTWVVVYQVLNADSRNHAYAGMFNTPSVGQAIELCKRMHEDKKEFKLLVVTKMKGANDEAF